MELAGGGGEEEAGGREEGREEERVDLEGRGWRIERGGGGRGRGKVAAVQPPSVPPPFLPLPSSSLPLPAHLPLLPPPPLLRRRSHSQLSQVGGEGSRVQDLAFDVREVGTVGGRREGETVEEPFGVQGEVEGSRRKGRGEGRAGRGEVSEREESGRVVREGRRWVLHGPAGGTVHSRIVGGAQTGAGEVGGGQGRREEAELEVVEGVGEVGKGILGEEGGGEGGCGRGGGGR